MRGIVKAALAASIFIFAGRFPALADAEDCNDAIRNYNSALSTMDLYMQDLRLCVAYSKGRDDCAVQFSSLQMGQADFEGAVSRVRSNCE